MTEDKTPKRRALKAAISIGILGVVVGIVRLNQGLREITTAIVMEPLGFLMERMSEPSNYLHDYLYSLSHLNDLRSENKRLRLEVAELRRELNRYREEALENARLKVLLRVKNSVSGDFLLARVVGYDPAAWRSSITINLGIKDGVQMDDAVLAGGGVVGRILMPTIHYSKVMLLTDRNSHIPAIVQRSRVRGILVGAGGGSCILKYVSKGSDVAVGDRIVTSGLDESLPKGLLLGIVVDIKEDYGIERLFQYIEVKPLVDLDRLEEVMVMVKERTK